MKSKQEVLEAMHIHATYGDCPLCPYAEELECTKKLMCDAMELIGQMEREEEAQSACMLSPFINDPCALVAIAFAELYPGKEYKAELMPSMKDEQGGDVFGETLFCEDGDVVVKVSADMPIHRAPEILAHELAHVAVGIDAGHGEEWEKAFDAIHKKYYEVLEKHLPGRTVPSKANAESEGLPCTSSC